MLHFKKSKIELQIWAMKVRGRSLVPFCYLFAQDMSIDTISMILITPQPPITPPHPTPPCCPTQIRSNLTRTSNRHHPRWKWLRTGVMMSNLRWLR